MKQTADKAGKPTEQRRASKQKAATRHQDKEKRIAGKRETHEIRFF